MTVQIQDAGRDRQIVIQRQICAKGVSARAGENKIIIDIPEVKTRVGSGPGVVDGPRIDIIGKVRKGFIADSFQSPRVRKDRGRGKLHIVTVQIKRASRYGEIPSHVELCQETPFPADTIKHNILKVKTFAGNGVIRIERVKGNGPG